MSRNNRLEIDMLTEYISSIRNNIEQQRRAFSEYTQSITELNRYMYQIIELYFALTHRASSQTNDANTLQPTNNIINSTTTTPRRNLYNPSNYTTASRRNTTTNVPRNSTSIPIQTYFTQPMRNSTRNENTHTRPRNLLHLPERRTTTGSRRMSGNTNRTRQTFLQQMLQTSLYAPTIRRPSSVRDISRNTQSFFWREIQNQSSQLRCPITLETFQPGDLVSRITNCGHIFHQDALNTYLIEYDNRCPICRYNISNDIISTPRPSSNNTNTTNNHLPHTTPTVPTTVPTTFSSAVHTTTDTTLPPEFRIPTPHIRAPTPSTTPTGDKGSSRPTTSNTYISQNTILPISSQNERPSYAAAMDALWDLPRTNNSTTTTPPLSLYRTCSFFDTDISRNNPEFNFTNTNIPPTFNLTDDNISDTINEISSVIMSSLNSVLSNPDNSGNTVSAEYSLFVPTFTTNTQINYDDNDNVE